MAGTRATQRHGWSGVALYRLDETSERGARLRQGLAQLGVAVRTIEASQLNDPVGTLAGLPGFRPSSTPYEGEAPTEEFMLFCGMEDQAIYALLDKMRTIGVRVGCKAGLTDTNRLWTIGRLMAEVAAEHAMMTGGARG